VNRLPVYILAGGKSSRFGSDKARAVLHGEPAIVGIARAAGPIAEHVTVVAANAGSYDDLGLRTIGDTHPGAGPLAGLHAALVDNTGGDWLCLLSCDLVRLEAAWIEQLMHAADDEHDVVAFKPDRWQPLVALYHRSILPLVTERLDEGRRAMQGLLDAARTRRCDLPSDWPEQLQMNTPEEWQRAARSPL
jgi:molybdopterin-guanine dinucleotide biosynthesis protein A